MRAARLGSLGRSDGAAERSAAGCEGAGGLFSPTLLRCVLGAGSWGTSAPSACMSRSDASRSIDAGGWLEGGGTVSAFGERSEGGEPDGA